MQWHRCEFFRNLLDGAWRRGDVRMNDLKKLIREVPDYPKPGILFYDLTTLLKDKEGFHTLIDRLCDHYKGHTIDVVAGIEARGFIFAPALAYRLNAGFVPVRKPKKLPAKTASVPYSLEYRTNTLQIHEDAVKPGQRVIISHDLLATRATAAATKVDAHWRCVSDLRVMFVRLLI